MTSALEPVLLLALAAPVGVIGWGGWQSKSSGRSSGRGLRSSGRSRSGGNSSGAGSGVGPGAGGRSNGRGLMREVYCAGPHAQARGV
jgi:hypothetical protein